MKKDEIFLWKSLSRCITPNSNPKPNVMKWMYLFTVLIMMSCGAAVKEEEKTIKVVGEGKIRVKPDKVTLSLHVNFTRPRMADAVSMTQATIDSVVAILEGFSTNENDIKTSSISANKDYEYNGRREVFVGYSASQSIDFVLNDLNRFTDLTGKLLETKINSIANIQFGHTKADSLLREADLLAYDDALKSANKLCGRADVKLGRLVHITNVEGDHSSYQGYSYGESINTYNKAYGGRGFRISPEVLEFGRTIISEYRID